MDKFRVGNRYWIVSLICFATVILLGFLRTETDVEYAFASFALLPLFIITWVCGKNHGIALAFLVSFMWLLVDRYTDRQFSSVWVPWVNAATRLLTYSAMVFLLSKIHTQLQKERELATHDVLTPLKNRRYFIEIGEFEIKRANRHHHSVAVIFLDLDDFKKLNDLRGHAVGDMALKATAEELMSMLRASDHVARLGGDEFAILLLEIDYAGSVETGHKIFNAVENVLKDYPPVTCSIGIAWFEKVDRTFPEMLKVADDLMYEVKKSGKGHFRSQRFGQ